MAGPERLAVQVRVQAAHCWLGRAVPNTYRNKMCVRRQTPGVRTVKSQQSRRTICDQLASPGRDFWRARWPLLASNAASASVSDRDYHSLICIYIPYSYSCYTIMYL